VTKQTKSAANFRQGKSVAERERGTDWGSPANSASPLPPDQHGTKRCYMGHGVLPVDSRRQPAMPGDELARQLINLSSPQIVHTATTRPRGMPGKETYPGSGPTGRVKAVIRHDYGLGPLVTRPADLGADPVDTPAAHGYLRAPEGPGPDVLSKYVAARGMLPEQTAGSGYPRLPRYHQLSPQVTMGDELYAPFEGRQQR